MSLSPLVFTGVSTYSTDFQMILTRAASIAALPIKALQNQQTDLLQQKLLVTNLNTAVGSLSSSLFNLGSISAARSLAATSSNSLKVTATNVNASSPAVYTISNITSISKAAAETSLVGYSASGADPVSTTGYVDLVVGPKPYHLNITGNNTLAGLRDAINNEHAGVTATVLTTGTGDTPNYLSVTADTPGKTILKLTDDPTGTPADLLTANNQGADTEFKLNGVAVKKASSFINDVVPGVTFNILGTTSGAEQVTVSVSSDTARLSNALSSFTSSYNSLRDQVNGQVGEAAGLLSGDFLVREVQSRLRTLTSYNEPSGSVHSLSDLGITFDSKGVASFDQTSFDNLSSTQVQDAFTFLGSGTVGFGGLSKTLSDISDSVTGLGQLQLDSYANTNKRLTDQISVLTERASGMQKSLEAQLHVADALLGSLQSQQSILTATIQSLNYSTYGKTSQ